MKTRRRPPRARMARARRADRSGNARATVRGTRIGNHTHSNVHRQSTHPCRAATFIRIGRDGPGKIGWKSAHVAFHPPTDRRPALVRRSRAIALLRTTRSTGSTTEHRVARCERGWGARARRRCEEVVIYRIPQSSSSTTTPPNQLSVHCTALHVRAAHHVRGDTSGRGPPATLMWIAWTASRRAARGAHPPHDSLVVCARPPGRGAVGRGTTRPTNARAHHHINRVASSHARTPASTRQAVASRARDTGGAPRLCHRNALRLRRGAAAARVGSRLRLHFQVWFSEGFIWSPGRHAF